MSDKPEKPKTPKSKEFQEQTFKKGKSGNPNGRPVTDAGLEKKIDKMMSQDEIIFEGDPLAYMAKHAEYLSRAGSHQKALELAKEIMPYLNPRMSQIAAQREDNDLVIRFEDPEVPSK